MKSLTVAEIESARQKVMANASELLEEAELLFRYGHFARAYAVAQLCCEELAKPAMLVRAAATLIAGREMDWRTLDRRLRSHTDKVNLLHYQEALSHPLSLELADEDRYQKARATTPDLNRLKNESLYSGVSSSGFSKPSEVITEAMASSHLALTRERLTRTRHLESLTSGRLEQIFEDPTARAGLLEIFANFEGE
jgi:AbiV family abortive infection protein